MAVVTVAFEDLNSWLHSQPANTVDTPYELNVTGITASNIGYGDTDKIGTVLYENSTKYVDLSATVLSSDIVSLYGAFDYATALVEAPIIPDGVTDVVNAFAQCALLKHKPILPSSVTTSTDCFKYVTTVNWKGTKSQIEYLAQHESTTCEVQQYNDDRVTLEDTYTLVKLLSLNGWLSAQPENTVDTPYKVKVSYLNTSNTSEFSYALRNNPRKYVDLSYTVIPDITGWTNAIAGFFKNISSIIVPPDLSVLSCNSLARTFEGCSNMKYPPVCRATDLSYTFQNCTSLIEPPVVGRNAFLKYTFFGCTSLLRAPEIPTGRSNLDHTFQGCTSLREVPEIPANIQDMTYTFAYCTSLEAPAPISSSVKTLDHTYYGCTNLEYKYIIPSTVTTSTDCYTNVPTTKWRGTSELLESWIPAQTAEFEGWEIEDLEPTGRIVYGVDISNLDTWLSDADANTVDTPYEIKVLGLTSSNVVSSSTSGSLGSILINNPTKFVDLGYTVLPSLNYYTSVFNNCISLILPPPIPANTQSLYWTFGGCINLKECPEIPNTVFMMSSTFNGCKSIKTPPVIPNGVTSFASCFINCESLETASNIPTGATDISSAFRGCKKIVSVPTIPSGVTNITDAFSRCTSLEGSVSIPSGVTSMNYAFEGTSITEVTLVPSTVTTAKRAFKDCTSLRKINEFQIPLNTLKNNANFQNMFQGCTSLSEIGYVIKESSWHVWRLKYGSNTVEGKVYFADGTSSNIPSTQITKSDLQMPIKTDELWFPTEQEEDIDELIGKMIQFKYGMYKKETIPPDEKTMVLWADNASHFKSNVPFVPVDEVTVGNKQSVTSNAVADCLSYSETEHRVGTWIDGKPLYEKTGILRVPANGYYHLYTDSNIKVRDWRGNFFQTSVDNPDWIMHIPYTYINSSNNKFLNIYVYYNPANRSFECTFTGTEASTYYNGYAVITYKYTKNTD